MSENLSKFCELICPEWSELRQLFIDLGGTEPQVIKLYSDFTCQVGRHHFAFLLVGPVVLGQDVGQFCERRLRSDVRPGKNADVQERFARLVEAGDPAGDALRHGDDQDAAIRSLFEERQDILAIAERERERGVTLNRELFYP